MFCLECLRKYSRKYDWIRKERMRKAREYEHDPNSKTKLAREEKKNHNTRNEKKKTETHL